MIKILYNMIMAYFDGLRFGFFDHVPACAAWIDRRFKDYYALNFAAGGRVFWRHSDGRLLDLPAPVAWWTWPNARFVYGQREGRTWDHYYITFSGSRAQRMFRQELLSRVPAAFAVVGNPQQFRQNFERLISVLRRPVPDTDQAVHTLEGMCLSLHNSPETPEPNTLQRQIEELAHAIRLRPSAQWDFIEEADRLSVSLVHLRRLFRQSTGIPVHQFVIRSRMEQAAGQLRSSDKPIKQIAAGVGFEDLQHFAHAFRRLAGMPPGQYRREYHKMGGAKGSAVLD